MEQGRPDPVAGVEQVLRRAAWALPVSGGLLVLGTVTHQPDPTTAFPAYARYVTTDHFLAGHLVASIGGAALAVVGLASVAVLLALRSDRPVGPLVGAGLSTAAHVLNTAVFGVAAFTQPAIGRAAAQTSRRRSRGTRTSTVLRSSARPWSRWCSGRPEPSCSGSRCGAATRPCGSPG